MLRKSILALLLVVGLSTYSIAQSLVATFGDQNSSKVHRMQADTDGVITFASDTGIKYPYEIVTSGQTLTAAETGKVLAYNGADISFTHTLPDAEAGLNFTVLTMTAGTMNIDPQANDYIYADNLILDAGDKITSSGDHVDAITLFAIDAEHWIATSVVGTFTDGS